MLKTKKDITKSILASITGMSRKKVFIGIPQEDVPRKPLEDQKVYVNNATLAFIHTNGSPADNIPSRPFLVPGIEKAQEKNIKLMKKGMLRALTNRRAVDETLNAVGLNSQSAVKAYMRDSSHFQPLSERTIKSRLDRKHPHKGTKPLIDTTQLLNSITYVIRRDIGNN